MIAYTCDYCRKPIADPDPVYELNTLAQRVIVPMFRHHFHYKCVAPWFSRG